VLQVAEYLHGVGDSDNFLVRTLGGTIGAGLVTRIVRGYTFISRNYRDGDKIFIVGFSRGAYTARALAGLIANEGLLDATKIDLTDKIHAYRLGSAVWFANRRKVNARINASWFDRLEGIVADLPGLLTQTPPADKLIPAPIEAVAVWDTVGALGIPEFTMTLERVDAFQFADRKLSPAVQHGVHAVAVDEQRADFEPTLWDPDPRIVQALFPGAHGDVGGGFPVSGNESGLSDCTLSWMIGQLTGLGVQFAATPTYNAMPRGDRRCASTLDPTPVERPVAETAGVSIDAVSHAMLARSAQWWASGCGTRREARDLCPREPQRLPGGWRSGARDSHCVIASAGLTSPVASLTGDAPAEEGEDVPMKKVAVFGNAGGGKSTLSSRLAEVTGLPLYTLDIIQFRGGRYRSDEKDGGKLPDEEYVSIQRSILSRDEWIIDGYGSLPTVWERISAADTLVYIDLPIIAHYWGVTQRFVAGLFRNPKGWPETSPVWESTLDSYRVVWLCHRRLTPRYRQRIAGEASSKQVHHLTSRAAMKVFLQAAANERRR
jgi:adenylate kinase family enzyme